MIQTLFEVLAFLAVIYLVYRYVWQTAFGRGRPGLGPLMEARQAAIARQLAEAAEARDRLQKAEADYRRALSEAEADAERIRDEARAEAAQIVADLRRRADAEAERIRARGEDQLAAERTAVVAALRAEVGRLAAELAGELVDGALADPAAQQRVVDRFLETLESGDLGAAGSAAGAGAAGPRAAGSAPGAGAAGEPDDLRAAGRVER